MRFKFSFWFVLIFVLEFGIVVGPQVYRNLYYLNQLKNIDTVDLATINYIQLPKMLYYWPGAKKLINAGNYRNLKSNDKIKGISKVAEHYVLDMTFSSPDPEDNAKNRSASLTYSFGKTTDLSYSLILFTGYVEGGIVGKGHLGSRMQIELTDANGKKMRSLKMPFIFEDDRMYVVLRPTLTEPIPMGSVQDNFDVSAVKEISIYLIPSTNLGVYPATGKLFMDNIFLIDDLRPLFPLVLQPDMGRVTYDNINLSYRLRKMSLEKEEQNFFVGINYPWDKYGWDVGKNPYGEPENSGWSANEAKLRTDFEYFKQTGIEPVRIYIFFDLRTGLEYKDGELVGFDKYVRKDIEAMFRIAGETGVKIIPVLFDFGMADGQRGYGGEHPELIFGSQKWNFLANILKPLLVDMDTWNKKYGEPVFALELMNEPDNMPALLLPGYYQSLKIWFRDMSNIIHNETSFKVTLGSHSIVDMQKWWDGLDIDVWQFHYYKYMLYEHEVWPQTLDKEDTGKEGPMFAGEMQPYDISANIEAMRKRGYSGVLPWAFNSTDGFELRGTALMDEIIRWIDKNLKKEDTR